jgi:hypothetical protein
VAWGVAGSEVHPPGSSRVEFTLVPVGAGTRLDLIHRDLPDERAEGYTRGWEHFLSRLVLAAPGGDAGTDPWLDRWAPES